MPGYDRTGPAGAGPRTGRGRGRCGRAADQTTAVEDPNRGQGGSGDGRRRGGGRRRGYGHAAGGRRGFEIGRRATRDTAECDVTPRRRQARLRRRIRQSTAQLDPANPFLSDDSVGVVEERE